MHRQRSSQSVVKAAYLSAIACSVISVSTSATAQAIRQTVVHYPSGGVLPGFGWNLTYDAPSTAECIIYDTQTATGQILTEHFARVADKNSMFTSLQISASAKMKAIAGSGSLEANFARSSEIDNSRLTLSIVEEVRNGPTFVVPKGANGDPDVNARANFSSGAFTLKPWAAALLVTGKSSDRLKFLQRCGNGYVQSVSQGARLVGSFSLRTHSDAESQSIATSAQGGGMGMSFSAGLKSIVNNADTMSTLLIDIAKVGGSGDPAPISEDDIDKVIVDLPKQAKDNPSAIEMIVRSYDGVIGYNRSYTPDQISVDKLADAFFDTYDYIQIVTDIINNFSSYSVHSGVLLQDLKNDSDSARSALETQAAAVTACTNDAAKCAKVKYSIVDIYALRSHLPLLVSDDPVDNTLEALENTFNSDIQRLVQVNAQCTPRCGSGGNGESRASFQTFLRQTKIPADVAQYNTEAVKLAQSIAASRIIRWVRQRRDVLCNLYPDRPCLPYYKMDELQAIIQTKIVPPMLDLDAARAGGAAV